MTRPAPAPLLILTGPPGAGKTTVARVLAQRAERAVHLESDRFFDFIEAGRIEPWRPESHDQNTVVMRIVARAAADYAQAGYFTIVDGIVIPGWFLEPVRDTLTAAGHAVAYVVLRPPLSVCLERAATRAGGGRLDPSVGERLWRQFDRLGPLEANVVEPGPATPSQTADLVYERLEAGSTAG